MPKSKGRILRMKLGYNPNSSSLGTEIQALLFGSAALSFLVVLISTVIRLTRRRASGPIETNERDHQV